jgi:hypothetical protein
MDIKKILVYLSIQFVFLFSGLSYGETVENGWIKSLTPEQLGLAAPKSSTPTPAPIPKLTPTPTSAATPALPAPIPKITPTLTPAAAPTPTVALVLTPAPITKLTPTTAATAPAKPKTYNNSIGKSYYIPHIYLSGYGGSNWLGNAQMVAPVLLSATHNLYIYGEGSYAAAQESDQNNSWSGDFGIGYRQILNLANKDRVYGAYLLGSYNHSSYGNDFLIVNPGIETLGKRWDFRANGYMPVNKHSFATKDFASNHGDYSHVNPHDNQIDDELVTYYENIGYGADTEFGGRLFSIKHMPIKAYIDGYYFNVNNSDIKNSKENDPTNIFGAGARITFQPTNYLTFEVKDTYDNEQSNVIEAGIKIYLNGFRDGIANTHVDDQDIQMRLFDPIEHNFGTISTGTSAMSHQGNTDHNNNDNDDDDDNPVVPVIPNAVFFNGGSSTIKDPSKLQGTAENPYPAKYFNQALVDQTHYTYSDQANFVMSGGTNSYVAYNDQNAGIELYTNENILGYNGSYTSPAKGSIRPNIYGALNLDGGNTIDGIILYNNYIGKNTVGINVKDGAQGVSINNSDIGQDSDSKSFETGVSVGQGAQATITSSSIYGYKLGIKANTGSNVTINDTAINVDGDDDATGIYALSASVISLENDNITANSASGLAFGFEAIYAADNKDNAKIAVTNTNINVTGNGNVDKQGDAAGIAVKNNGTGLVNLKVNGGQITTISKSSKETITAGIYLNGASLTGSPGKIMTTGYETAGIIAIGVNTNVNLGSVDITAGDIKTTELGAGIELDNGAQLTINNGSITANGSSLVGGIDANESTVYVNTTNALSINVNSNGKYGSTIGINVNNGILDFSKYTSNTLTIKAQGSFINLGINGSNSSTLKGLSQDNINIVNFVGIKSINQLSWNMY